MTAAKVKTYVAIDADASAAAARKACARTVLARFFTAFMPFVGLVEGDL